MPELPDITLYLKALESRVLGRELKEIRITSPFLLRTAVPPANRLVGRDVMQLRRMGKRIVFGFTGDLWLVLHLMIAGRLHWTDTPPDRLLKPEGRLKRLKPSGKNVLANFDFPNGSLRLTEAGTRRRASIHLVQSEVGLKQLDPGGLEVLDSGPDEFARALRRENHTLKRALTDPHLFSGIGNAYSDEILHEARLSPIALTQKLTGDQIQVLHRAAQNVLRGWIERLKAQTGDAFPENVTAFRPEMAVHGKFGSVCPRCGARVQRIRYAENETNYCPRCQTGGRLLADRSLSLLLKRDWPKTAEELEEKQAPRL
jgi:formamidopyrimidine-DNA glycosylase